MKKTPETDHVIGLWCFLAAYLVKP